LVYGGSGTGKTHLIGTLGELGKVLVIDIDQGYKTIVNAPDITQQMKDNIIITTFDQFKDLDTAFKLIVKNDPKEWSKALKTEIEHQFEWIVWDTWSEIQWSMMQQLRANEGLLTDRGVDIGFRKNVQIQHWGSLTDLNKLAIEQLKGQPINQIFTMQEKVDKNEITGEVVKGPAIHGKLTAEMPAYFDVVVHTYADMTGKFCATTLPKQKWPAKTRLGVGKDYINPTAKQIFGSN
jgi:hypothetical protein